jgi:hypothetical protein
LFVHLAIIDRNELCAREDFRPAKCPCFEKLAFARSADSFLDKQPHDFVCPVRRLWPVVTVELPQSQMQFQAALFPIFPARLTTTRLLNRWPMMSSANLPVGIIVPACLDNL